MEDVTLPNLIFFAPALSCPKKNVSYAKKQPHFHEIDLLSFGSLSQFIVRTFRKTFVSVKFRDVNRKYSPYSHHLLLPSTLDVDFSPPPLGMTIRRLRVCGFSSLNVGRFRFPGTSGSGGSDGDGRWKRRRRRERGRGRRHRNNDVRHGVRRRWMASAPQPDATTTDDLTRRRIQQR